MRSPSQNSIHRRLGRAHPNNSIPSKPSRLDSRSPQFGPPFGGNFGGDRGRDRDRDGDRPGQGFGGGSGNPFAGRPNPGPSFGRPESAPPFGRPNPQPPFAGGGGGGGGGSGGDQRPPFGLPSPRPPSPPAPAPSPVSPPSRQPANPPQAPPPPPPSSEQPSSGGGNQVGGDGSSLNNGDGNNNNRVPATNIDAQGDTASSSSRASLGTPVVPGASPTPLSTSRSLAASTLSSTSSSPLETLPVVPIPSAGSDSEGAVAPNVNPIGAVSKKGLSSGIIAAIVLLSFFFLLMILVLFLRRRWVSRRSERLGAWWTNRRRNSRPYGDNPTFINEKVSEKQPAFEWNRDDFAVRTMDRSASPLDLNNIVPVAPPVAEVRRLRNGTDAYLIDPSTSSERFSVGSGESFVVHHTAVFSPNRASGTESFKFPKPPSHSDLAASIHSRLGSNSSNSGAASVTAACGHTPVNQSQPSLLGSRPPLTAPSPSQSRQPSADGIPNPFADADGSESCHNPFANESISIGPLALAVGDLARAEKIRRPFLPTMNDELSVAVDDEVKILQIFDDGWALVEKLEPTPTQGLIPLACLRDMGQGLTSLLSTRRAQSIHVSEQITE